jgi:hypothetical protein
MARTNAQPNARNIVSKQLGMSTEDTQKYQVYDNEVYERRTVHKFSMGDCEDPEIYVAQPIYEWQKTEHGKWVMEHSRDPTYHLMADQFNYGYAVLITAHITPKRWTEYCLRFIDKEHP